jgi:hypothetical protein
VSKGVIAGGAVVNARGRGAIACKMIDGDMGPTCHTIGGGRIERQNHSARSTL